jgi:adenine-specific DNA-methyltransferase
VLPDIEQARLRLSKTTETAKKSQFGQFFTPTTTASFMADLFPPATGHCRLLDAGAGIGSLSNAFLEKWLAGDFGFNSVELDSFEIDATLQPFLAQTLARFTRENFTSRIHILDFIPAAVASISGELFAKKFPAYTHVILNPPYKKIAGDSPHRLALRRIGIETVNLYSAFVALAVALAAPGGQIVAIIPRSFCNGPYYRPFRDFILERAAIHRMHLFASRTRAFKADDVLQENIIIHLERGGRQGPVRISTSTDDRFSDLSIHEQSFDRIVMPKDPERFIHVPLSSEDTTFETVGIACSLGDLGLGVSTGPVVDFRLKAHLRDLPEPGTVPLLYPSHFDRNGARWPIAGSKKPNAISRNAETEKWLYPNGFYCVVRRLSSKEEKRRVVASVVDPNALGNAPIIGFENHLNVFHVDKHGMPQALAHGLTTYLNTSAFDEHFRRFNGHTQVNATDLRAMKYPSRETLVKLGKWAMTAGLLEQQIIDDKFREIIA